MQNPFIWLDLMTPDVEAAKTFYAAVVGWTFSEQMPAYTVTMADGIGMGGIMETPPEMKTMPPIWSGYVYTPDVDACCQEVVKIGGKILRQAWDVPDVGRIAVIGDPTGAGLMVMQPFSTEQQPQPKPGTVGTVGWNELHAGNLDEAFEFYSKLFGWTNGNIMDMGPMGNYLLFQINGKDIGGMMKKAPTMPMATWAYYIMVDGIDAAVVRITKNGGKTVMGPPKFQVDNGSSWQWIHKVDFSVLSQQLNRGGCYVRNCQLSPRLESSGRAHLPRVPQSRCHGQMVAA